MLDLKEKIQDIIIESLGKILNNKNLNINDDFFEMGGNSYLALLFIFDINEKLTQIKEECNQNINIPNIEDFYYNSKIYLLLQFILDAKKTRNFNILSSYNKNFDNVFLFPSIIGSPTIFNSILDKLDLNFFAVSYIIMRDDIYNLSSEYSEEIIKLNGDKEVYLLGYSFGGTFCFEVARILEKKGLKVNLIILDSIPNIADFYEWNILSDENFLLEKEKELTNENVSRELEAWKVGKPEGGEFNLIKEQISTKITHLKNFKLLGHLHTDILFFEAEDTNEKNRLRDLDAKKIWIDTTSGFVTHKLIKGDHYSIMDDSNFYTILNEIKKWLEAKKQVYLT